MQIDEQRSPAQEIHDLLKKSLPTVLVVRFFNWKIRSS
jgi:hypothetical protein